MLKKNGPEETLLYKDLGIIISLTYRKRTVALIYGNA